MANKYDIYTMSSGAKLVIVNGYTGEEDFYKMHQIINELLTPEASDFSVDSMCVGGFFRKDGLLVRTSSESPYDDMSFFYDPTPMTEAEAEKVAYWIDQVVGRLHEVLPRA